VNTIDLGDLSFYWRMTAEPAAASAIPRFLPFAFGFDPELQLITQAPDATVLNVLQRIYLEDHNIGYMQPGHSLADTYGQDFLKFILQSIAGIQTPVQRVLDVGCGGCYVLRELQSWGYHVFGIDPSPVSSRFADQFAIPIVTGFYPCDHGFGRMDLVLSSGILEHVPDPLAFLRGHLNDLTEDGHIIISVPDSEPSIVLGDVSMILHEHVSYFDEGSLRELVTTAGFDVISMGKASYGCSLYCCARISSPGRTSRSCHKNDTTRQSKFSVFGARLSQSLEKMESYLRPLLDDAKSSVGFYVPLRPLPYLSIMRVFDGFRFFDDDPGVHGRYFEGFDVAVENFQDLQNQPVTHMVIMSLPHAKVIERRIRSFFGDSIAVTSLEHILSNEHS
jgi:SAM-dependent methyltransferase